MTHKTEFFHDEVRNGFYIPTAIKQAWAAELDVLGEIDRICRTYGITYYADWGTFLGAVRHGGFVPWDDDLDICMRREDYQRFRAVADEELPEEFCIHDYERQEDHWLFLARVVNSRKICFEEDYLKRHHNFPWIGGVDIFLQDYLYKEEEEEKKRCREVMQLIAVADGITEGSLNDEAIGAALSDFRKNYRVEFPPRSHRQELAVALYRLAEEQMARVRPQDSDMLGQIFPWILKGGKGQPKAYYEKTLRLPFEDTTIPVPAYYHTLLSARYRNYQEIRKVWTGHHYPFFEAEKADMERVAGEKLFDFRFWPEMLKRPAVDKSNSLKRIASECMEELKNRHETVRKCLQAGDIARAGEVLSECQQIAVDLGNLIEQAKGEESACAKAVVTALESYCEALYQGAQSGELSGVEETFGAVASAVQRYVIDRREVLFLPVGAREWRGFAAAYDAARKEADTEVSVVPLPLLTKNPYGQVDMTDEEIREAAHSADYPSGVEYGDWMSYDVSLHCPDVIYLQNPYDGENPCLTVPPDFYAQNLRSYTDRLVYLPIADTAEFGAEDYNDHYNMRYYVTAPGVIYADRVLVQSENIREQYVKRLIDFAGADTEDYWREKIAVRETEPPCEEKPDKREKRLLYCIGANELLEHRERFLEAVQERFTLLRASGGGLTVGLSLYPPMRSEWEAVEKELSAKFFAVLDDAMRDGKYAPCEIMPADAERIALDYDAYYGSPSPLVPAFVLAGKPVMLCDYEIKGAS